MLKKILKVNDVKSAISGLTKIVKLIKSEYTRTR